MLTEQLGILAFKLTVVQLAAVIAGVNPLFLSTFLPSVVFLITCNLYDTRFAVKAD